MPLSDGGEGIGDILTTVLGGVQVPVGVHDARGHWRQAHIGWVERERLAVVESALAVGLGLIEANERDIMTATSRGVGEMLTAALDLDPTRIILGLGGTATNDGGAGMLQALGVGLVDAAGQALSPGGAALLDLASVDFAELDPRWALVRLDIACDVSNPLTGPQGASAIFGPQKGATANQVEVLDRALVHLAAMINSPDSDQPGIGAAGGMALGLVTLLSAKLTPGIELVLDACGFDEQVAGSDLVLTGEGSIDSQTAAGKTPLGVARAAARHGVGTIVFAGKVNCPLISPFQAMVAISDHETSLRTALANGPANLRAAVARTLASWGK
jgi:glycerate kinase